MSDNLSIREWNRRHPDRSAFTRREVVVVEKSGGMTVAELMALHRSVERLSPSNPERFIEDKSEMMATIMRAVRSTEGASGVREARDGIRHGSIRTMTF